MRRRTWAVLVLAAVTWQASLFLSLTPGEQGPQTVRLTVPTVEPTGYPPAVLPDPDVPARPFVASPEPPVTRCTRRGCAVITDPVGLYYASCSDVPDVQRPLRRGEPGYRVGLDRDRDGWACDE